MVGAEKNAFYEACVTKAMEADEAGDYIKENDPIASWIKSEIKDACNLSRAPYDGQIRGELWKAADAGDRLRKVVGKSHIKAGYRKLIDEDEPDQGEWLQ